MDDIDRERRVLRLFEKLLDEAPEDRRRTLDRETIDDPEMRTRIEALLQADSEMELRTGGAVEAVDEPDPPERIGHYRIGELIGSGGMGSVYAASRDVGDFTHEVAIKLIKPGALSEKLIERFSHERQVLAQFSHPHIARLLDGGEIGEGQPFIVMERVNGVSLSQWLKSDPSRDDKLRLFLQICDAVAHAHRNLVIHRDLTPSNVLVDAEGQAKLIDFGIARPDGDEMVGAGREGAIPLARMTLTPGYAAPERLRGERATTLSDIYSAGRLLAEMFPRPRDDEMQAIIEGARAEATGDRYQTMNDLADDIRNMMADRPVSTMPTSTRYRIGKFIKRNRAASGMSLALVAALVIGLGAAAWSWSEAVTARNEAEERYTQVRELAGVMLFDIYDEIARVPGSEAARERLAAEALTYLDSLAEDPDAPIEVRLEAARGYLRLGQITGGFSSESLGRLAEGRDISETGLSMLHALYVDAPDNAEVRQELSAALTRRSRELLYATGDSEQAMNLANDAISLFDENPSEPEDVVELAEAYTQLGEAHHWESEYDSAIATYSRAITLLEGLPDELQRQSPYTQSLAGTYELQGRAYGGQGEDWDSAITYITQAVDLHRNSYRRDPSPTARGQLSVGLYYLLQSEAMKEDFDNVRAHADEGLVLMRSALADSPDEQNSRALYAAFALQRASLHARDSERSEALALVDEALEVSEGTLAAAGGVAGAEMRHAVRLHEAAVVEEAAGAHGRSCAHLRRAVAIFDAFAETQPIPESNRVTNYEPMLAALEQC